MMSRAIVGLSSGLPRRLAAVAIVSCCFIALCPLVTLQLSGASAAALRSAERPLDNEPRLLTSTDLLPNNSIVTIDDEEGELGPTTQYIMRRAAAQRLVVRPQSAGISSETTLQVQTEPSADGARALGLQPLLAMFGDQFVWSTYVSQQYFHLFRYLQRVYGWAVVEVEQPRCLAPGLSWVEFGDCIVRSLGGRAPDVLLFVESFGELAGLTGNRSESSLVDTQLWLFMNDLHHIYPEQRRVKAGAITAVDVVLGPYMYLLDHFFAVEAAEKRREWIPHAATSLFQLPLLPSTKSRSSAGVNRTSRRGLDHAVLLSGSTSALWYPYRSAVEQMVLNGDRRFVQHRHPGYEGRYDPAAVGRGYARILNRHVACITDGLIFNYSVAKMFELPAAGCLLLVNDEISPVLGQLGFQPFIHYVPYTLSSLNATVDAVLDPANAASVDAIRAQGQALVWARHTVQERAAVMHRLAVTTYLV